jgi:hypothetical protein
MSKGVTKSVFQKTLQTLDMTDRSQRLSADLADTLGNCVGGGEDLLGLFVEQEMIVTKMRPRYMPVEILRLQVKREHVRQEDIECDRDVPDGIWPEVGWSL